MAGKFTQLINKMCKGLLHQYNKIYYVDTQQFYSHDQNRMITMFVLSEGVWSDTRDTYAKQQVLKSASQIDIVKYLGERLQELAEENQT